MKILFTSALIADRYEERRNEYIRSYNTIKSMGFGDDVRIVECVHEEGETFLNELTDKVTYTCCHRELNNKGVKEARCLIKAAESLSIPADEMIVKLTGRYLFKSSSFLSMVENSTADAVFKKDQYSQVFFGCFAMRYGMFLEMLKSFDLEHMERRMINIEFVVARYIERNFDPGLIQEVKLLDIMANVNNCDISCW